MISFRMYVYTKKEEIEEFTKVLTGLSFSE